ncbi:MAG: hypothetical protein ACOC80_05075 [Petrotogales bacterium]
MEFSYPPNESSKKLQKILGLDDQKVTEFHIHIKKGEPSFIEIKQVITVEELEKIVEVLRKYNFKEDV